MEPNNLPVQIVQAAPLENELIDQPQTPQEAPKKSPKQSDWNWKWFVFVLILLVIITVVVFWLIKARHNKPSTPVKTTTKVQNVDLSQIENPVATLDASASDRVVINGLLQVNKNILITPTAMPAAAKLGLLYLDETTKQLRYYNGTSYVTLLTGTGANYLSETQILNLITGFGPPTVLPQDLATNASPTFNGLSIISSATIGGLSVSNNATIQGTLKIKNTTLINSAASDLSFTLPSADGVANQCLTTNGAGVLGFAACSSGVGVAFVQGGNSFGSSAILGTNDANDLALEVNNATQATLAVGGAMTFQNTADSTSGFRVMDADGGNPVLNVDTANERIGIGTATPTMALDVVGSGTFSSNLSVQGNTTLNGSQLTNNGSTLFVAQSLGNFALSGDIGAAAATVDITSSFSINQTTAGRTLSLPNPTTLTVGRVVYVVNVGSTPFAMHGVTVTNAKAQAYIWNGTNWVGTNVDGAGSGVTLVGTLDAQAKSSDGAVISANSIFLQTADITNPGLVSTGTQTFAGAKTFNSDLTVNGNTTIGDAVTDNLTLTAVIQGANAIVFDGATNDTNEITLQIADPGADYTIILPAENGTICTTGSICSGYQASGSYLTIEADTLATVTGRGATTATASSFTGGATVRSLTVDTATATDDRILVTVATGGAGRFDGTVTNAELTGTRTWTLPNETGTICTTGSICSGYQASGSYFAQNGNTFGTTAVLGTNDANDLAFETNNSTKLTIQDATGNIGIGDTTPLALLTVGNGDLFQVASNGNLTSSNAGTWTFSNDTNFALTGGVNGLSFDTNTLSIDGFNNRVGVGTATPGYSFDVQGGDINTSGYLREADNIVVNTTTGTSNTYIGVSAGNTSVLGSNNAALGYQALYSHNSFDNQFNGNTAVGYQAGHTPGDNGETASYSTFIGYGTNQSETSVTNSMALGYNAAVYKDNQVVIGNTSVTETLIRGNTGIGIAGPDARLELGGNATSTAWGLNGIQLQSSSATYTDSSTAAFGTATDAVINSFATPTIAATNANVTTTNAATVYIQGAPTAGTNQLPIPNAYALWVDDGTVRLDGSLTVNGNSTLGDTVTDNLTLNAAIQGANALIFDGSTNDTNEITLAITDPGADYTITLPAETGTVCLNSGNCLGGVGGGVPTSRNLTINGTTQDLTADRTWTVGDMLLGTGQSVTALKTFDKDMLAMKGTSTGITTISTANTGASNYTATLQAASGTIAYQADTTYIGTTSIALNRASAAQSLTGITSIDGSAASLTTSRNIQGVAFNGTTNIDIINGTGFVKATGTALSYDNSTYLTTEADTLATVTGRGATTATASSFTGGAAIGNNASYTSANGLVVGQTFASNVCTICKGVSSTLTIGNNTSLVTDASAYYAKVIHNNASENVTNGYGLFVDSAVLSTPFSDLQNNYGIYVANQNAGNNNYGMYIADATTNSLLLASDDGDAASGITFGTTDTANLYRSTANTLKTDDSLIVASNLTVDTNTLYVDASTNRVGIGTTAPSYDLSFGTGANRTIGIEAQTTADTAGNNLTISSAQGNGTGASGNITLAIGAPGATSGTNGTVTIQGTGTIASQATAGIAASNILTVTGVTGGDTSSVLDGVLAGAGSGISLALGNGGRETGASGDKTGAAGGAFTLQGGTGGVNDSSSSGASAGNGSAITMTTGTGGAMPATGGWFSAGGSGGTFTLQGGTGGANSSTALFAGGGRGANLNFIAGTGGAAAGASGFTGSGTGGAISLTGGAGGVVSSADGFAGSGGGITLQGGAAGTGGSTPGSIGNIVMQNLGGNVGIGIAVPTSALHLGSDAGTAVSGINFGSTADTNLYRGAANQLKTDDTLLIKTDSATAFQVQDTTSTEILTVDTTNKKLVVRGPDTDATLGSELAGSETCSGTNWAGTGPWTHSTGSTTALTCTQPASVTAGATYQITFTVAGNSTLSNTVTPNIGGVSGRALGANTTHTVVITASTTATIYFSPTTSFNGSISAISVKLITFAKSVIDVQNSSATTTLEVRSSGIDNTFIGLNSGRANTSTGDFNSAVGTYALQSNTDGVRNTAMGYGALKDNTTAGWNSAFGSHALISNTTGANNSAFGASALGANTTGSNNIAFGVGALNSNTTGGNNSGIGTFALYANTTGTGNSALGYSALGTNTTGINNSAVGHQALDQNTTGSNNTAFGLQAGFNAVTPLTAMNTSSFFGRAANSSVDSVANAMALGYNAQVTKSNQVVIGNTSVTETLLNGNVGISTSGAAPSYDLSFGSAYRTIGIETSTGGSGGGLTITAGDTADSSGFYAGNLVLSAGSAPIDAGYGGGGNVNIWGGNGNLMGGDININSGTSTAYGGTYNGNINIGTTMADVISIGNDDVTNPAINIQSGTGTIAIGTGAQARTVNIATGAAAQIVTLGSTTGASSVNIKCGTGSCNFGNNLVSHITNVGSKTGAGATNIQAGTQGLYLGDDAVANTIQIGNTTGAVAQTINLGNNATASSTSTVVIGSTIGGSAVTLQAGTGGLDITTQGTGALTVGNNAVAQTITVGNGTGATSVTIACGTGSSCNFGTNAIAHTTTVGTTTGAGAVTVQCGTGTCAFGTNAIAHTTNVGSVTGAATTNIQAGTGGLKLGDDAVANTIQIGNTTGAVAQTVNLGNNATASSTSTVVIGSTIGTSSTTLYSGSGGVQTVLTGGSAVAVCSSLVAGNAPTAGTPYILRDCNAAPTADYAEQYPVANDVEVGDVVSQGPTQVNTYNSDSNTGDVNWDSVKGTVSQMVRASLAYDPKLVGVVSDNNSDFVSAGYNIKQSDNPKSIALNGRVLVKISTENGAIEAGDFLTSSATRPGYAMKATQAGYVIGQALAPFDSSTPGTVMVYIRGQYYPGPDLNKLTNGDLNISGTIATKDLEVTGTTTIANLVVTNSASLANVTVTGNATVQGKLTVGNAVVTGNIMVNGHYLSEGQKPAVAKEANLGTDTQVLAASVQIDGTDTAGTLTLVTGDSPLAGALAKITFNKSYENTPRIVVSATNEDGSSLPVFLRKVAGGFEIVTNTAPQAGKTYQFDYIIVGSN